MLFNFKLYTCTINILLTTHFICAHNIDFCTTLRYIFVCASFVSQQLQLSGLVLGNQFYHFMIFLYQTFTKFITFLPRIKAKVSLLFLYCYLCPQGEITTLYIIVDFKSVALKKNSTLFFLLFQ